MTSYYSHGKLLLTGEYVVLDGALSLALPTKKGQWLEIQKSDSSGLVWHSYDDKGILWLEVAFELPRLRIVSETFQSSIADGSDSIGLKLQEILLEAKKVNPEFLAEDKGYLVKSKLEFSRNWGLGSSSTLINNIANWAGINAFELQFKTFGGSAYDIACAQNDTPITYKLIDNKPFIDPVPFSPNFKEQLYFVFLNKKKNSRDGIAQYSEFKDDKTQLIKEITNITQKILTVRSLDEFNKLIATHEAIISSIIKQRPIKEAMFPDYFGELKSLGAWGGDFILATGNEDTPNYFASRGYHTIISYNDMIATSEI